MAYSTQAISPLHPYFSARWVSRLPAGLVNMLSNTAQHGMHPTTDRRNQARTDRSNSWHGGVGHDDSWRAP